MALLPRSEVPTHHHPFTHKGERFYVWWQTFHEHYGAQDTDYNMRIDYSELVFISRIEYNTVLPVGSASGLIPICIREALHLYVTNGGFADLTINEYLTSLGL